MSRAARETTKRARAVVAGFSLLCLFALTARPAFAGGPLGKQGERIETSGYTLDLFQGPILASSRVTGMGGAYSALAEGAEGVPFNAASASQRYPYSTARTDYDLTASITFPRSIRNTDFDNNGSVDHGFGDFVWVTVGGLYQRDHFGLGVIISAQNYSLGRPAGLPESVSLTNLTIRIYKVDAVASYGFLHDELHVGGGLRSAIFTATAPSEKLLLGTYGIGAQGGALWRPRDLPLRLGATIRSPVLGSIVAKPGVDTDSAGDQRLGSFYLPEGVNLPWEAEWGAALQLGPRPLNIGWTDEDTLTPDEADWDRQTSWPQPPAGPHLESQASAAHRILRRKYRQIVRDKLLLSFSMLVTGPTHGAVGVESLLTQVIDRSGEQTTVTMRGGVEAEVLPNRLQFRAGSYLEPTRFRESSHRLHGTTGFEVRVLDWSVFGLYPEDNMFRISGAVDYARGYFGWSLGIGSWY